MNKTVSLVLFLVFLFLPTTCQCENDSSAELHSQTSLTDDIFIEVVDTSWDLERLYIVPVIEVSLTNKSSKPINALEVRVVFYNVDKQTEWETRTSQVVSSNGPAFENGEVRSLKMISGIGYAKPFSILKLPQITCDLYLNGKLAIQAANIEKPDVSIELATEAVKKLRAMLRDPASMQIHSAYMKTNDKNTSIVLEISAKNGYGGIVRAVFECIIEDSVCISCIECSQFDMYDKNEYQELDVEKIASPLLLN